MVLNQYTNCVSSITLIFSLFRITLEILQLSHQFIVFWGYLEEVLCDPSVLRCSSSIFDTSCEEKVSLSSCCFFTFNKWLWQWSSKPSLILIIVLFHPVLDIFLRLPCSLVFRKTQPCHIIVWFWSYGFSSEERLYHIYLIFTSIFKVCCVFSMISKRRFSFSTNIGCYNCRRFWRLTFSAKFTTWCRFPWTSSYHSQSWLTEFCYTCKFLCTDKSIGLHASVYCETVLTAFDKRFLCGPIRLGITSVWIFVKCRSP